MTPIRWPLLADAMEAEQHEDEPFGADALAVEATECVARSIHNLLIPAYVLFAFAIGAGLAIASQYGF